MKGIKKYSIAVDNGGIKSEIKCSVYVSGKHECLSLTNGDVSIVFRDTAPAFAVMLSYLEGGLEDYARVYALMLLTSATALPDEQFVNDVCAFGERLNGRLKTEMSKELTEDEKGALQYVARAQSDVLVPDRYAELLKEVAKETFAAKERTRQALEDKPSSDSSHDTEEGR